MKLFLGSVLIFVSSLSSAASKPVEMTGRDLVNLTWIAASSEPHFLFIAATAGISEADLMAVHKDMKNAKPGTLKFELVGDELVLNGKKTGWVYESYSPVQLKINGTKWSFNPDKSFSENYATLKRLAQPAKKSEKNALFNLFIPRANALEGLFEGQNREATWDSGPIPTEVFGGALGANLAYTFVGGWAVLPAALASIVVGNFTGGTSMLIAERIDTTTIPCMDATLSRVVNASGAAGKKAHDTLFKSHLSAGQPTDAGPHSLSACVPLIHESASAEEFVTRMMTSPPKPICNGKTMTLCHASLKTNSEPCLNVNKDDNSISISYPGGSRIVKKDDLIEAQYRLSFQLRNTATQMAMLRPSQAIGKRLESLWHSWRVTA